MLESGVDILIGTTGRLIDYAKQNHINLGAIQVVVLDEADRMYDLGFIKDIRWLFRRMPPTTQRLNMLFSATLSYRVRELAFEQMNNAEYVEVEPEQKTGHRIKEELFYPSNEEKMRLLQTLIEEEWPDRAIVFANTYLTMTCRMTVKITFTESVVPDVLAQAVTLSAWLVKSTR